PTAPACQPHWRAGPGRAWPSPPGDACASSSAGCPGDSPPCAPCPGCPAAGACCPPAAAPRSGSANTYTVPPGPVTSGRSCVAPTKPSAPNGTSVSSPPATTAPDQPPTPDAIATYCRPSGPMYVIGCPMIPDSTRNCQSTSPVSASTALNQRSIVP